MTEIYYPKSTELLKFEKACGVVFSSENLNSRNPKLIDLRDIFVSIVIKDYSHKEVAEMIDKSRCLIYDSIKRFNYRYSMYVDYRMLADEITEKYATQHTFNRFLSKTN